MFEIKGKKIILTGSVGHIGYQLALGLLKEKADLICIVKNKKKKNKISEIQERGARIIETDLSNIDNIDNLFSSLRGEHIHGVINNAAFSKGGDIEDISFENWKIGIDGVLNIPFYIMQKSIPLLKPVNGSIVNIASMYGIISPDPANYTDAKMYANPPNYGSAKAGLIQLTKYAAVHLARYNIRVNSISPGTFPNNSVKKSPDFIEVLSSNVPLGRIGNPKELLGPVIFLISSAASYITGENIIVDGGWTVK